MTMPTDDRTDPTTRALRDLDAADRVLGSDQRRRSVATLERILATDPGAPPTTAPGGPARPRRRRRPLLAAAGAAACVTAALVVGPTLTGGSDAFASWSAVPSRLTGTPRAAALEACLVLQGSEGGELALAPGATGTVLLAESRGGWDYLLFRARSASGRRLEGSCLMPERMVQDPRPGEGGFFGSLGPASDSAGPAPAARAVRQNSYGVGVVDDDAFVYAEGRAGSDVRGIEVTTAGGRHVRASLAGGRWAAWWPAGDASQRNPEITGAPTYRVTLRDGTVRSGLR